MVDAKNVVVGLMIAITAAFVFFIIFNTGKQTAEAQIASLFPDIKCPEGVDMEDYITRMRTFAAQNGEPAYAIDVFKEYLACKNPVKGPSRFNDAEIEQYHKEMLNCANAAYVNYGDELKAKKQESEQFDSEEDVKYYSDLIEENTKEYETFRKVFSGVDYSASACNFVQTPAAP